MSSDRRDRFDDLKRIYMMLSLAHSDVVEFVRAAVREIDEWYQQQLRMVQAADEHRY